MKTSPFVDDPRFVRKCDVRLALELGLDMAIFIQQVHYHATWKEETYGGQEWRSSLSEWEKTFPFWSKSTIQRIIKQCHELGILKIRKGAFKGRLAVWFSLDYEMVNKIGEKGMEKLGQIDHSPVVKMTTLSRSNRPLDRGQNDHHLIKQNTNTTEVSNTNKRGDTSVSQSATRGITAERVREIKEANRANALARFEKSHTVQGFFTIWQMLIIDKFGKEGFTTLSVKDKSNLKKHFFKWCDECGIDIIQFIGWCVDAWAVLRARIKWAKLPEYPTFSQIYNMKDHFLREYRSYSPDPETKKEVIYTNIDQVPADHPLFSEIKMLIERRGKAVIS